MNPVSKGEEQTEELPFCNNAEERKQQREPEGFMTNIRRYPGGSKQPLSAALAE